MADQLDLFGAPAPAPRRGVGPAPLASEVAALAAHLPRNVRLGTSSWSFPGWAGIVYDRAASSATLARHGLAAYARHPLLRAVGIDRTYYAPITADDFAAYAAAVGDDFRFLIKAPEALTTVRFADHPRYGEQRGARSAVFLDPGYATDAICAPVAEGLGERAGVLVFQFAPQPPALLGGPGRFAERLHGFLDRLPRGLTYAVELRTEPLFTDAYRQALRAAGACHVVTVHPTMPAPRAQAAQLAQDAPAVVVRWMLGHGQRYDDARQRYRPFDRLVDEDPASRAEIATLCRAAAARGRAAYVIINNKAEGSAPLSAQRLAAAIVAAG
ncbi:DUF72 domain-containing protein [bacterium]|nr:DUF72 domain-containing protein [bacterium]